MKLANYINFGLDRCYHLIAREHDNKSADCGNTEGGKKSAEKSDKTRGKQERNSERQQNQKNNHFIFSFSFDVFIIP